jgi:hypothetical protein
MLLMLEQRRIEDEHRRDEHEHEHDYEHERIEYEYDWLLLVAIASVLAGCQTSTAAPDSSPGREAAFYSPQGIAATESYILVASTAFHYTSGKPDWGAGFVTVVDRKTRVVVGKIPSTQPNPQSVATRGTSATVVNGGTFLTEKGGPVIVTTGGGLDLFDLSSGLPGAALANVALGTSSSDRRIGGYGTIALDGAGGLAYVGSGTRGDVFLVDLSAKSTLRGPEDPIAVFSTASGQNGLTVVRTFGSGTLAILDYNTDSLCLSSDLAGELEKRTCHSVGVQSDLLEGPIDVARAPDGHALVLMTIANELYRVDVTASPFSVEAGYAKTGLAPNRVLVRGQAAYIVNSASNNLQRVDLSTGKSESPFAVFPVSSGPYDAVITDEAEGDVAWVTLQKSHQVALVLLSTGAVLQTLPSASAVDAGAGGAHDARLEGPGADRAVSCKDGGAAVVGIVDLVSATYGAGAGEGQSKLPQVIQGGPKGGGASSGSSDVLSLGVEGEVVVDFGDYDIVDGPGDDFIVFENPFLVSAYCPYAEPAVVGVSSSSTSSSDFVDFPCDLTKTAGDPKTKTWPYPGCAGVRPVLAGPGSCTSPTDPLAAGGDAFDLGKLGVKQARYLRLRDAGLSTTGTTTQGFDLDAVVLIHYKKR